MRTVTRQPRHPDPLPPRRGEPAPCGPHAVQVLRTYPAKQPDVPVRTRGRAQHRPRVPEGAAAGAAARLPRGPVLLVGDRGRAALADALARPPELRVVVVVPRFPDRDGRVAGPAARIGRERATRIVERAPAATASSCATSRTRTARPIYVHAKVCIVDDVWLMVGSDNMNRRSWTHDSELSCAVLDDTRDEREPRDPAGLGDGARLLAPRHPAAALARAPRAHRGRPASTTWSIPTRAFAEFRRTATGARRTGTTRRSSRRAAARSRAHPPTRSRPDPAPRGGRSAVYRVLNDPDGRSPRHSAPATTDRPVTEKGPV